MRAKYYGKAIKRNEFGDIVDRFSPQVTITFPEKEEALVRARLDATGYRYDMFGDDIFAQGSADVYVSGKEEADEFMGIWKEVKKRIKNVP